MRQQGSIVNLALKLLWRDWRGGELNVLASALLVAVTTVTGISLFTDRIQRSILDEAGTLLAADAQIRGSRDIPREWQAEAIDYGLTTAQIVEYEGMSFGPEGGLQLSSVKAVSSSYPLKGQLEIADEPYGETRLVSSGPLPGEAWVHTRLFAALNLALGDVIGVGDADFTVTAILVNEPDNAGGFGLNPRVMIHLDDLAATNAIQVGSRADYHLLLAGDTELYQTQWQSYGSEHHRWRTVEDANESITSTLARAESFLLLAGSLGVILAGVALALASRRYASRQLSHVALLKTLGLTPKRITQLYAGNLFVLGGIVVLFGIFLGWFLHWVFLLLFEGLLPRALVAPSVQPFFLGLLTGFVCLIAFALPPIWVLRNTPPAKVIRSEVAGGEIATWKTTGLGALAVIALVYFYSRSWLITGALVVAGVVAIIGVSFLARVLIWLTRRIATRFGTTWRIGLASLQRHSRQNSFQIMIFAMALMLLFLLGLVRTTLLSDWQQQLPEGTPNHFIFNIFEEERTDIEDFMTQNEIDRTPFYPMLRGRLVAVGDEPIQDRLARLNPSGDDYQRELNITWSTELAADNEVVAGDWFTEDDVNQSKISIEQEYAEELDIAPGDEMTFSFGGQLVVATVDNIRTVQWDSMSPNFYVIFSGPILGGSGAAYLTSFYLSAEQKPLLIDLLRDHPTVTLIEVDAILERIQTIVGQVTMAIEFILVLVLLAGLIVLVASIQATLDSRLQESAILRTLGARAGLVRGSLAIEFIALGALAGLLAAVGAEVAVYFLQTELLGMEFTANPWLFAAAPFVGAIIIGFVGLASTRKVVLVPPLAVLRQI